MGYIQNNEVFEDCLKSCSPKIIRFISGINSGTASHVDFFMLDKIKMADDTVFRIVEGLRTFETQAEYYKKGREVVYENDFHSPVLFPEGFRGTSFKVVSDKLIDKSKVVTYARAGRSYHNYGLAVDIVPRISGYAVPITVGDKKYNSLKDFYFACGLVAWAKDCGLSYGGDWSGFSDDVHFEDNSFNLPSLDSGLLWSDNGNFNFIKNFNNGFYDNISHTTRDRKGILVCSVLALAGVIGLFIYKKIKRGF